MNRLGPAVVATTLMIHPAMSAPAPADTAACLATGAALYQQAEKLQKATKLTIPREFVRVSANLDEYCEDKAFEKARITIAWMEVCIKNYRKPYKLGFCTRNKIYFCAIDPASEACKG